MIDFVFGYDDVIKGFVAEYLPATRGRDYGPSTTIGIVRDGTLVAGVVYSGYRADAGVIEMTAAAMPKSRPMTREVLRVVYAYPFEQLRCQMLILHVDPDNATLLRQLAALGYAFIRIPRMYGRDKDCILCLLTSEAWASSRLINGRPPKGDQQLDEAA